MGGDATPHSQVTLGHAEALLPCATSEGISLFCFVPTLFNTKNVVSLVQILDTWGKQCDGGLVFITEPGGNATIPPNGRLQSSDGSVEAEVVVLQGVKYSGHRKFCAEKEIPNRCKHLWEKTWRSWLWVFQNTRNKADYFLKVDDDTVLFVDVLRRHLARKGWAPSDPHYFGHVLYASTEESSGYAQGSIYGLSKGALDIIGPVFRDSIRPFDWALFKSQNTDFTNYICYDRPGGPEDVLFSRCMQSVGIKAEDMADKYGRDTILIISWRNMERKTKEEWYMRGKPQERLFRGEMARYPIALHDNPLKDPAVRNDIFGMVYSSFEPQGTRHPVAAVCYPSDFLVSVRSAIAECTVAQQYGDMPHLHKGKGLISPIVFV